MLHVTRPAAETTLAKLAWKLRHWVLHNGEGERAEIVPQCCGRDRTRPWNGGWSVESVMSAQGSPSPNLIGTADG